MSPYPLAVNTLAGQESRGMDALICSHPGERSPSSTMKRYFPYEKSGAYQQGLDFAAWAARVAETLQERNRALGERLVCAAQAIPYAIAQAYAHGQEHGRYLDKAREHAVECAVALDLLVALGTRHQMDVRQGKERLAAILAAGQALVEKADWPEILCALSGVAHEALAEDTSS